MSAEPTIQQIPVELIIPNRFQPRLLFDEQGLNELAASIKEHGIIQPLVLRAVGDKYEIIAGERRYKAATLAGLTVVPAIVSNMDDNQSAEVALIENVQRRDLSSIEEARSYRKILEKNGITQELLAKRLGLSQASIANKLRLLNLDQEIQDALMTGKISERHARSLLQLNSLDDQRRVLKRILEERLTVRQLDIEIKKIIDPNGLTEEPLPGALLPNNNINVNQPLAGPMGVSAGNNYNPNPILMADSVSANLDNPFQATQEMVPTNPIVVASAPEVAPNNLFDNSSSQTSLETVSGNIFDNQIATNSPAVPSNNIFDNPSLNPLTAPVLETPAESHAEDPLTSPSSIGNSSEPVESFQLETFDFDAQATEEENTEQMQSVPEAEKVESEIVTNASEAEKEATPALEAEPVDILNKATNKVFGVFDQNPYPSLEDEAVNMNFDVGSSDFNPFAEEENNEPSPTAPEEATAEPESIPEAPEPEVKEIPKRIKPNDLSSVTTAYKELAKEIKDEGYPITTEEFDFEDLYQIIIKIDKQAQE